MKLARFRIDLLHLRILFDGEGHTFDVHKLRLTTWKLLASSAPGVSLNVGSARHLVEDQARQAIAFIPLGDSDRRHRCADVELKTFKSG